MNRKRNLVCQTGRIEQVAGDRATVRMERSGACESCAGKSTCHELSAEGKVIEVINDAMARPGQRVELGLQPAAMVTASFLMFLLPAAVFLVGIAIGYVIAENMDWPAQEWVGFGFGALAFALVLLVIRLLSDRHAASGKYEPVIIRILENTEQNPR